MLRGPEGRKAPTKLIEKQKLVRQEESIDVYRNAEKERSNLNYNTCFRTDATKHFKNLIVKLNK